MSGDDTKSSARCLPDLNLAPQVWCVRMAGSQIISVVNHPPRRAKYEIIFRVLLNRLPYEHGQVTELPDLYDKTLRSCYYLKPCARKPE